MKGASVSTVLDVGTGTGVFAEAFSNAGVDVTVDLLASAREYVPAGSFVAGAAEELPLGDGSFDLVFLGHVLHETDNLLRALEQARRVARVRVVVLEWPYRDEEFGPPLADRLKSEEIGDLARKAGLREMESLPLSHMDLYTFVP